MTYCVGVLLRTGLVFASDSRTNAGVDNIAKFCKMTIFERPGERVIALLSSGNLAGTQAVISMLKQRGEATRAADAAPAASHPASGHGGTPAGEAPSDAPDIWNARTMFDVANVVSSAVREVESRDAKHLEGGFNASFIIGGQILGEPHRLFRTFAEGNFIEAGADTPFLQTGETKYGKPIIDRVITPATSLTDTIKCVLLSFDSTMRSNLSVGLPIDLACYELDSLKLNMRRRFDQGDPYFTALSKEFSDGVRRVFTELPALTW